VVWAVLKQAVDRVVVPATTFIIRQQ
jgi:hypothetical protein